MGPTPSLWHTAPGVSAGKPGTPSAMIHTWTEHRVMHCIIPSPATTLPSQRCYDNLHFLSFFQSDLVQRPHRDLGDIVGDELPGGALRVAGGEALSVPQVTCVKTKQVHFLGGRGGVDQLSQILKSLQRRAATHCFHLQQRLRSAQRRAV